MLIDLGERFGCEPFGENTSDSLTLDTCRATMMHFKILMTCALPNDQISFCGIRNAPAGVPRGYLLLIQSKTCPKASTSHKTSVLNSSDVIRGNKNVPAGVPLGDTLRVRPATCPQSSNSHDMRLITSPIFGSRLHSHHGI